jgi:choloylglycine hydrolase
VTGFLLLIPGTDRTQTELHMKKTFSILILIGLHFQFASACTTFFIHHNGQMIFGRNYDWVADAGLVCTNQRGLAKSSYKNVDKKAFNWVSKYGSITFNQYGKEFPTGGMNEKGLVVELMWLDETEYPKVDERSSVEELQWVQYQLDNCSTIEEVIATDKTIRIASNSTPLHFLVADASGKAATIEFLEGKLVAHYGKQLPFAVLTNDPYERSVSSQKDNSANGSNSLERFNKACDMVKQFVSTSPSTPIIDYSFSILEKVAQGSFTKWQIVYDISNKKIYFRTEPSRKIKSLDLAGFDFDCKISSKALNMNTLSEGDISKNFTDLTPALNKEILEKSLKQSQSRIQVKPERVEAALQYARQIACFKS